MLTKWLKKKFAEWSKEAWDNARQEKEVLTQGALITRDVDHSTTPKLRVGVIEALNGKILEVTTSMPMPNTHSHCDWKTEMYIIPEGQKLSEAIGTVMLMKGLEK